MKPPKTEEMLAGEGDDTSMAEEVAAPGAASSSSAGPAAAAPLEHTGFMRAIARAEKEAARTAAVAEEVLQQEEATPAEVPHRAAPVRPADSEVDEHERNHVPYRSWCAQCVEGRLKDAPHRKIEADPPDALPVLQMDYCFPSLLDPREKITILTGADKVRGSIVTVFVRQKGSLDRYVVQSLVQWSQQLGFYAVILQSDGEPSMVDIVNAIHDERTKPSIIRTTPKESKGSLGVVEQAHWSVESLLRTFMAFLKKKYGHAIPVTHRLIPWLVRHLGWTLTRHQKKNDGRTAYERIRGKPYKAITYKFSEKKYITNRQEIVRQLNLNHADYLEYGSARPRRPMNIFY